MATIGLVRRAARDRAILAVLAALVGLAAWFLLTRPSARPARLRFSAGHPEGLRHAMAGALVSASAPRGVDLLLVPTAGSEDALRRIQDGRIDLALVQGGLAAESLGAIRQVAALHVEPLHLLVRGDLASEEDRGLDALKGRTVNLGERGSGTRALAEDVLRFAGLEPGADYTATELDYEALQAEPAPSPMPDAVFTVSLLPSPVVRHLVARRGYRLFPLPFGEAYSLDVRRSPGATRSPGAGLRSVRRELVMDSLIPAFTYGVRPAVPPGPLPTLGARLLLVAREGTDPEAVARVLEATFASSFAQLSHPRLTPDLLDLPTEFPPHPGLALYRERSKPLITGDVIDAVEKELSIGGALLGAGFFLWQWLKSRYRRLRESGFEHYILRVAAIEDRALRLELAETLDLPALLALQDDLGRVKAEAIAKFAEGELEGEDLLSGFLAQASDARDHLTRLILHRRDALERLARKQKRDAAELWREANSAPNPASESRGAPRDVGNA